MVNVLKINDVWSSYEIWQWTFSKIFGVKAFPIINATWNWIPIKSMKIHNFLFKIMDMLPPMDFLREHDTMYENLELWNLLVWNATSMFTEWIWNKSRVYKILI